MRFLVVPVLAAFLTASLQADTAPFVEKAFSLVINPGEKSLKNVPVRVPLSIQGDLAKKSAVRLKVGDATMFGQLIPASILTQDAKLADRSALRYDLVFILPTQEAKKPVQVQAEIIEKEKAPAGSRLEWTQVMGTLDLLRHDGDAKPQPLLRYMGAAFDDSTKEQRNRTYKVFHHMFDPEGKRLVTNGGHADEGADKKKLEYPHHRGLMFAFNRITYGDKKAADVWHCTGDAHQAHQKDLVAAAGPVAATHRAAIGWHGVKKEQFATELREMTVWNLSGGTLVEFADQLLPYPSGNKVKLDGDPQHAGFQFRAANDLVEQGNNKLTYYLRPDGQGKPGETRNWEPKTKKGPINLPWNAMSFVLDGQRYTVCYLDHPRNPGEKRYSERDYGRFGCYFEHDLSTENPLRLNHRIWLQRGEMTGEQVQALADAFTAGPRVEVK